MANPRAKNWFFQCDNPSGVDNDIVNQVGNSQLVAFMICGRKQVEGGNALYGYVNFLDRKRRTEIAGQFPPQTVLTHAKGNVLNNTNTVRSECIEVREFGGIEFASTQGKTHDPDLVKMREAIKQQWSEQETFEEFGSKWIHLGQAMEKSVKKERKDEAKEKLKTQMLKATLRPWMLRRNTEVFLYVIKRLTGCPTRLSVERLIYAVLFSHSLFFVTTPWSWVGCSCTLVRVQ